VPSLRDWFCFPTLPRTYVLGITDAAALRLRFGVFCSIISLQPHSALSFSSTAFCSIIFFNNTLFQFFNRILLQFFNRILRHDFLGDEVLTHTLKPALLIPVSRLKDVPFSNRYYFVAI
jgi:hypothetical protein